MIKFKENLKKIRMSKTWSQIDLAKKIDVDPSYISRYENGAKKPSMDMIVKLSKALDCTIDELVIGENK